MLHGSSLRIVQKKYKFRAEIHLNQLPNLLKLSFWA